MFRSMIFASVLALWIAPTCCAYQLLSTMAPTRRDLLRHATMTGLGVGGWMALVEQQPAYAINACPPRSSNCIRTTWIAPDGSTVGDMATTIMDVLGTYPQEGQNNIDKGGWTIVQDELVGDSGTARIEFKSGIGNFAKFLNGGKPFIDDVVIEINGNKAEIRSSSRVGDSDLDVNRKRLLFLADGITSKGWTAPEPKY